MDSKIYSPTSEVVITDSFIKTPIQEGSSILFFNEASDDKYDPILKRFLYAERIMNDKEMIGRYKQVKEEVPFINRTFVYPELYQQYNMFVDLSYYYDVFKRKNTFVMDRGVDIYFDFISRILDSQKIRAAGYEKFTVFVPVSNELWDVTPDTKIWDYKSNINPFSIINRMMKTNPYKLKEEWGKYKFIFMGTNGYFALDINTLEFKDLARFNSNVAVILKKDAIIDTESNPSQPDSANAIVSTIVDKLDTNANIKINRLTGDSKIITQGDLEVKVKDGTTSSKPIDNSDVTVADKADKVVEIIKQTAEDQGNMEDTLDALDHDTYLARLLTDLAAEENNTVKVSTARLARIDSINSTFMKKSFKGQKVSDLIQEKPYQELPSTALKADSINKEWENMTYMNFNSSYNIDEDIMKILYSFSEKSVKIGILDIKTEDTSTSEDYIETYTVNCEDEFGKRFTLTFDIPKFKNNRFMRLRGNEKTISGQLMLLPVIKTAEDTVQIVSNYNKIFIRRYGSSTGKSYFVADRIIKTIDKNEFPDLKIVRGDNTKVSAKYDLPIDYVDLASVFTTLETKEFIIYFNQDEIRSKYKIDDMMGIPIGVYKKDNTILYYNIRSDQDPCSLLILHTLGEAKGFRDAYMDTKPSTKYTYSKASILSNDIPVIVILGFNIGLQKAMNLARIDYRLQENRPSTLDRKLGNIDYIQFNDGYIVYQVDYSSSLLMNGLKECDTANYSIKDMNSRSMWLDFLDQFGGRILADGLDNFYDLMVDPITAEVCDRYDMPKEYCEMLIYASDLLCDNKFNKHVDITGNRYRTNEIVAGYTYKALAKSYGDYRNQLKRSRQGTMSMRRTAVIDLVMADPTASDLSVLNPLLEAEAANTISFKGLSGMNSDRSYGLDKRTYDDTMINVLALSTGFAANVGINRQATIDMNIEGNRGYIKQTSSLDDMSITKTFSITEALTPFGVTRDDPIRSAMTFIQTSKHSMRVKKAMPQLITNGADEALPYMTSDTFSFKAKANGKITEKTDEYMIVSYDNGTNEFIDLRDNVKKNSDGGFYITIKLDTDRKEGSRFKQGDILAYDRKSFSGLVGANDNIAYNIGTLAKTAIMTTDEGFEDSTIVSDWLSDAMSSDVVVMKDITLPKNTNVYDMVKKGQYIQEGEPLIVFQNAFDEEDVNVLLKNITDDEELISELGRIPIKSKITGVVQDIHIYRTVETEELSDSLKKYVTLYEKPINATKSTLKKYKIEDVNSIEPTSALETTGKLKNAKDSVYIEFYLKYEDRLSIGDKLVATNAAKGVIKDIYPVGQEPTSTFRPEEKIHAMFATGSFTARMVSSVLIQGVINKGLIELDRAVKDIYDIPIVYIEDMDL